MTSLIKHLFSTAPDFCPSCGSILQTPTGGSSDRECSVCHCDIGDKAFKKVTYRIHFNNLNVYTGDDDEDGKNSRSKQKKEQNDEAEGPIVDRECKECGHKQMSYATLQLRSADEGQTVFYTCVKCKFKETENS